MKKQNTITLDIWMQTEEYYGYYYYYHYHIFKLKTFQITLQNWMWDHTSVITRSEADTQMFQMSWVQFLTAMGCALARALQLTEMRGQMKRPVST